MNVLSNHTVDLPLLARLFERPPQVASEHARAEGLQIEFHLSNYVELDREEQIDVITLINRDFGALTAPERDGLLRAVHQELRPGGSFVFDALSLARLRDGDTPITAAIETDDGFWAAGPHMVLEQSLLYREANAELDRQVIIAADGSIEEFRSWLTYYRPEDIREVLIRAGFVVDRENAFLSPREYEWPAGDLGFVARKAI